MADTHASGGDHGDHHAGLFWIYMSVALVLAVCTASSFIFNELVRHTMLSVVMGFVFILGVAILKSCLVGYYFMHLKWDWRLLYFIIVPVFILGTMMVIILMPDTVIGPYRDANFGLDFIPLRFERYDLVMRKQTMELPALQAFLDVLQRATLRRRLEEGWRGYDTSRTGAVLV